MEDVVEVVGDASGQLTHRLHLLGLDQLLFEIAPGRDVAADHHDGRVFAVLVDDGVVVPGQPAGAFGCGDPLFVVRGFAGAHGRAQGVEGRRAFVGGDGFGDGPAQHVVGVDAEGPAVGRVDEQNPKLAVQLDDQVLLILHQQLVVGLAHGQFHVSLHGQVDQHRQHERHEDADESRVEAKCTGDAARRIGLVLQIDRVAYAAGGEVERPRPVDDPDDRRGAVGGVGDVGRIAGGVGEGAVELGHREAEMLPQRGFRKTGFDQAVDAEHAVHVARGATQVPALHRRVGRDAAVTLQQLADVGAGHAVGFAGADEGLPHVGFRVFVKALLAGRPVGGEGYDDVDHAVGVHEVQGQEPRVQVEKMESLGNELGLARQFAVLHHVGEVHHDGGAVVDPGFKTQADLFGGDLGFHDQPLVFVLHVVVPEKHEGADADHEDQDRQYVDLERR